MKEEPEETRTTTTMPHTVPDTRTLKTKLQTFATVLEQEVFDWLEKTYPADDPAKKEILSTIHLKDAEVRVKPGRKYSKVDVGVKIGVYGLVVLVLVVG